MYYFKKKLLLIFLLFIGSTTLFCQTRISGTIKDGGIQEALIGVHIVVKGTIQGTITDKNGSYDLTVNQSPPLTITYSYLGFRTQEIIVNETNNTIDLFMQEESSLGQEIVISASRLEQRILKSPVTVEKMDINYIQQAPTSDFYDALAYMKGVQVTNSGLSLTSVNTRGFADVTNIRFVQIVDGMDTSDPTINTNLGSIHGLGELDIESLELLPGAGSALYGPNAFNGMMIMTSKSPFEYQGLSLLTKLGMTNSDAGGSNPMSSYSLRYAKAFHNKFAFKINLHYFGATDWTANDYKTDRNNPHSEIDLSNDPNFDGLNLHGDEFPIPINNFGIGTIRRTGIKEETLLDHNHARALKADVAIHYRINDNLELIGAYRYAGGSQLGQSSTKFAYRDFAEEFYKLELKSDNFFVRSYLSVTSIDKTYDVGALGALVNERFNPSAREDGSGWVEDYVLAFIGVIPNVDPNSDAAARTYADRFMIDPSTGAYVSSFQDVVSEIRILDYSSNPPGSSYFVDSYMWHSEFYYNFKQLSWADIIVGGNFRQYNLFSDGTIFNEAPVDPDNPERILTSNFGLYTQISKTLAEKFQITGSIRYDKMVDFEGHLSPRLSVVYSPDKNNNIRLNYQTAFRFPNMIEQFIFSLYGIYVGGIPSTASRYGVYNGGSWTRSSYDDFVSQGGAIDPTTGTILSNPGNVSLETANIPFLKPEQLRSFEIGYNGIIAGRLLFDMNYYHTTYTNFIGNQFTVNKVSTSHQGQQIDAGRGWVLFANSPSTLKSYGFGLGLTYNLPNNFVLTGNYTYATFSGDQPEGFLTQFNTPKNSYNLGIGNRKLTKYLGFNINFRYQDAFLWESEYGVATMPSYGLVDAQVNYKLPSFKTIVKIGATNIGGQDYRSNFGSVYIGQTYYISLLFDEIFN